MERVFRCLVVAYPASNKGPLAIRIWSLIPAAVIPGTLITMTDTDFAEVERRVSEWFEIPQQHVKWYRYVKRDGKAYDVAVPEHLENSLKDTELFKDKFEAWQVEIVDGVVPQEVLARGELRVYA